MGQHIERESRFEATGLTPAQRAAYVKRLSAAGWSVRRIAKAVKMSPTGVQYILKPRSELVRYVMCEGCWGTVPAKALNADGLCSDCVG